MKNQAKAELRRMSKDALVKQIEMLRTEIRKLQSVERNKKEMNTRGVKLIRQKLAIAETFLREGELSNL